MPKRTPEELEAFFRALEELKEAGTPLPDHIRDVAEDVAKIILSRLVGKTTIPGANAAFKANLKAFLRDEPPNPDPDFSPTQEDVINAIVTAMSKPNKPDKKFDHRTIGQSVNYFTEMAVDELKKLIEPPERRAERKSEGELQIVSLQEHEEKAHEVAAPPSSSSPEPKSAYTKWHGQRYIRHRLGKEEGDKWLTLFLLREEGDYEWEEIALSLQGKAPLGGWARAGQVGAGTSQPRNPAEVWDDLRSGYTLPDWNTVCG
jgi:hypothetical protein